MGVRGRKWRHVGGRVGRLDLGELRVVVPVVAGDGGAVGVWRREEMLTVTAAETAPPAARRR